MVSLGAVNMRTAEQHARGFRTGTVRRGDRKSRFDREDRELGKRNATGQIYQVCPMCSQRSSIQTRIQGVRTWRCESCGYADDERGPLN
jgi:rubredoxin